MKYLSVGLVFLFALSLCNLSEKFKRGKSTTGSSSSSSSTSGDSGAPAEHGVASHAQLATLEGGHDAKWDRQGMSFKVPSSWKEVNNES